MFWFYCAFFGFTDENNPWHSTLEKIAYYTPPLIPPKTYGVLETELEMGAILNRDQTSTQVSEHIIIYHHHYRHHHSSSSPIIRHHHQT